MLRLTSFFLLLTATLAFAEDFKKWSNVDKTKTFEGKFLSLENHIVTIELKDATQVTLTVDKLHKEDQDWIHHHLHGFYPDEKLPDSFPNSVFDTLVFGDDRNLVTKKLFQSKMLETKVARTHVGRTGLNGIFYTKEKISGFTYYVTFNWDDAGKLIEITLQSETKSAQEYSTILKTGWQETSDLLITIHGEPEASGDIPKMTDLPDDQMIPSHIWKLEQGGKLLLGTSKMEGGYQVVIRFSK